MTIFDPPICPECGAQRVRQRGECWLCGVDPVEFGQRGRVGARRSDREFPFSLSSLLLVLTLAVICLGVIYEAPGLGVFLSVMLVPALMHTVQTVRAREASGEQISAASKAGLLFGSFGLAVVLLAVIGVAAFCTLFGICLTVMSVGGGATEYFVQAIALCCVGVGAIAILISVRRRLAG